MARPKGSIPTWATDDVYSSGPDLSLNTKVEPLAGEKAQGYQRGFIPPARKMNWLLNRLCGWIGFTSDAYCVNWYPWDQTDVGGAVLYVDSPRPDGTVRACYSETHGQWIVPGHFENGKFYLGEVGCWTLQLTLFSRKLHIAVESQGRLAFFNADPLIGPPTYTFSDPLVYSSASFTAGTLPVVNAAASYSIGDAVALPSGRVLVCGTGNSQNLVWYSDDGCQSWTGPIWISPSYVSSMCTRIVLGPGNTVVVLGDGGLLWQSNDGGATWSERDLAPYSAFIEGIYLPGFDVWLFTTATETIATQEPASDAFVATALPSGAQNTLAGMVSFGDLAMFNILLPGQLSHNLFLSRDAFTGPMTRIGKNAMATTTVPPSHPIAFAVNSAGQFLMTTQGRIRTSLRGGV